MLNCAVLIETVFYSILFCYFLLYVKCFLWQRGEKKKGSAYNSLSNEIPVVLFIGMERLHGVTVIKKDSERPLTIGWRTQPNMPLSAVSRRRNYKLDLNKQTAAA